MTQAQLTRGARAGIVELWIVDLLHRVVEVHRRPQDGGYADVATYGSGETITLALAPEIAPKLTGVFD